nr:PEP/pyruvate-binding domain-containing protein [Endozoicomonas sp. YOMI1]
MPAGGAVISHLTLQNNTIQVEYTLGQPRGAVSGTTGIRPHRYTIKRSDDENSQPVRQFTPGDVTTQFVLERITDEETGEAGYIEQSTTATTDAKDIMLSDEILQKLQQYTEQLEDMFCCPVDIEFGVDEHQHPFLFQCRPVTQLPGCTQFSAPAPARPLAEGIAELTISRPCHYDG